MDIFSYLGDFIENHHTPILVFLTIVEILIIGY